MLPIPVNMMMRGAMKSPTPALSPVRRGSIPNCFIEVEIAELERMLPGPISPIRRASIHSRSSVDRDVAELERVLSPMRRNSIQLADTLPFNLDSMLTPNSPIRRGSGQSRGMHSDAESILDGNLQTHDFRNYRERSKYQASGTSKEPLTNMLP